MKDRYVMLFRTRHNDLGWTVDNWGTLEEMTAVYNRASVSYLFGSAFECKVMLATIEQEAVYWPNGVKLALGDI